MRVRLLNSLISICVLQACGNDGPSTPPIEEWCDLERPREDCKADDLIVNYGVEDARVLCETPCTRLGQVLISQGDSEIFKALHGFKSASSLRIGNADPSVKDLRFLSEFEDVKNLIVKGNSGLESLDGLEWLHTMVPADCVDCGTTIAIEANPRLRSLTGLRNLKVTGGITIQHNNAIETIDVFSNLESGGVGIMFNENLTSISGFEKMSEITASIWIQGNADLRKVDAWPNLTRLNALIVDRNRSLDECEVQRILDQLEEEPRSVTIKDNGAPCMP